MSSGGLGTACYGLTKGLSNHNVHVSFVLPYADKGKSKIDHITDNIDNRKTDFQDREIPLIEDKSK